MKLLQESEYATGETVYDNSKYHMAYHDLYESYGKYYDAHREYEYLDYK